MGTLYTPIPIFEIQSQEDTVAWLEEQGLNLPEPGLSSRYPTPNEIREAIESIEDCDTEYFTGSSTWQVTVSKNEASAWTSIVVKDYSMSPGEDDEPHDFYFEKGWVELIVDILQRLSIKCGPFVLFAVPR